MVGAASNWVLGAGRSGVAAAELLWSQGTSVQVFDEQRGDALPEGSPERVVVSPGFPVDHPWLESLRERNVPLVAEAELGLQHLEGRVLAITGSLGKTTMVELAGTILRASGRKVSVSGNIGTPVCEIARKEPLANVHVVELSSFQLELFTRFEPDVSILLNLLPNHLDRHGDMERYRAAKLRLFRGNGCAVVPAGFELQGFDGEIRFQGAQRFWHWEPGRIFQGDRLWLGLEASQVDQAGVGDNVAALCAGLDALGLDPDVVSRGLRGFQFPPHRREEVALAAPWRAVNDSKSTCLAATLAAMKAYSATNGGQVHLIVGGRGKGENLENLGLELAGYRPSVYLMGETAAEMKKVWTGSLPYCESYGSLAACVKIAWDRCQPDDVILLSPGCASFDQFQSYEDRGRQFRALVKDLDDGYRNRKLNTE